MNLWPNYGSLVANDFDSVGGWSRAGRCIGVECLIICKIPKKPIFVIGSIINHFSPKHKVIKMVRYPYL